MMQGLDRDDIGLSRDYIGFRDIIPRLEIRIRTKAWTVTWKSGIT